MYNFAFCPGGAHIARRLNDRLQALTWVVMAFVLFTVAYAPSAFAQTVVGDPCNDGNSVDVTPGRVTYDLSSIECMVDEAVSEALEMYEERGSSSFDAITASAVDEPPFAPFVIHADDLRIVANSADPDYVDRTAEYLRNANTTLEQVLALQNGEKIWVKYIDTNPALGQEQVKVALLLLHGDYIFGAGYYLPDFEVQELIEQTVRGYESDGVATFEDITPDSPRVTDDLYVFVINYPNWIRVADGVVPDRVNKPDTILDTSARTVDDVRADLAANGSTWATYTFHNPATDIIQLKRTWLYLHDGYVFGSGYYPHDSRSQSQAESAKIQYTAHGTAAFGMITPTVPNPLLTDSTFVLDSSTLEVVAHARSPYLLETNFAQLAMADKPLERIRDELQRDEDGIWVWYMDFNPATGTNQLTHAYIILYDGYIFGASSPLPDIRAQAVIDDAIYTYRNNPDTAFDIINSGALNRLDVIPLVINGTLVAHGLLPHLVGMPLEGAIERSTTQIFDDLEDGYSAAGHLAFFDPLTGITQITRALYVFHDGYFFAATYTIADADTQSQTDYARFVYESNMEDGKWRDILTPDEPIVTDDLYSFVIDLESWTRLADGVVPARVNQPETILDTSYRSVADVRSDLEENGRTWLTYTFHNPATGVEQLKRTYLQLRDGLVFGSGYYLLDSEVQAVAYSSILSYLASGANVALATINAMQDTPVSTYPFVVDPSSGTILAQGVRDSTIGTADWDEILKILSVGEIFAELQTKPGIWVSYTHTEPVSGVSEVKRTWLAHYNGLIFGSGYYTSDIPASDAKFVVNNAIQTYDANRQNDAWIDIITPDEPITTDILYPFVIDLESWTRLADGVIPARVGHPETILEKSGRTLESVRTELRERGSMWISYTFHNPATGIEQLKHSYLQLHNGIVFGSGYYVLDSRVQSAVNGKTIEYERDGWVATIAATSAIPAEPISTYAFIVDPQSGATLAQNVDPVRIGHVEDWTAITTTTSAQSILDIIDKGTGTWVSYDHTNPLTGVSETKRAWLVLHDGTVFGSGYYTTDIPVSDVRFVVNNAIQTYDANRQNDAWIDIITPDEPITTDILYPFVIDLESWTRLADGVIPARVGHPETILEKSDRTLESVRTELRERGSMWIVYTFHNPATGIEQLKHSYLQLHNGIVFGSGYYVLDSHVQSTVNGKVLGYERDGWAATITATSAIPAEPISTYAFIVDPQSGATLAQNVDPVRIGHVEDWTAITTTTSAQSILDIIDKGTGTWVSYDHTNPLTGVSETKRAWLVLHDGTVFGSGYYESTQIDIEPLSSGSTPAPGQCR